MHKTNAPHRFGRTLLLCACAALMLAGCKTEVYRGLTESQANAMMAVLLKNGIEPEKTADKEGYAIAVESDRVTQTLELMRENNLPRSEFDTMGDVFAAKGMISSATEEKARMTYALSQELSDTFSRIDGVLTARVHVVLQNEDLATGYYATFVEAASALDDLRAMQADCLWAWAYDRLLRRYGLDTLTPDDVAAILRG